MKHKKTENQKNIKSKRNKYKIFISLSIQIVLIVFISSYAVIRAIQYHTRASTCVDQATAVAKCYLIYKGGVYRTPDSPHQHHGHACGSTITDATFANYNPNSYPGNALRDLHISSGYIFIQLPSVVMGYYQGPICSAIPTPTPTPVPPTATPISPTPTNTPTLQPTLAQPSPTATPIPTSTPIPTQPLPTPSPTPTPPAGGSPIPTNPALIVTSPSATPTPTQIPLLSQLTPTINIVPSATPTTNANLPLATVTIMPSISISPTTKPLVPTPPIALTLTDFNGLVRCFGNNANNPVLCPNKKKYDLNNDGVIDGLDYNLFLIAVMPKITQNPLTTLTPTIIASASPTLVASPSVTLSAPTTTPIITSLPQVSPSTIIAQTSPTLTPLPTNSLARNQAVTPTEITPHPIAQKNTFTLVAAWTWWTTVFDLLAVSSVIAAVITGIFRSKMLKKIFTKKDNTIK